MASLTALRASWRRAWTPPPDLTVSQWADAERFLSPESSAEPGRWSTSRAEYQRGIMDALSEAKVHTVVVMTSAQVGKALALDTPIATPDGWTTMGDIIVGDQVFGRDGSAIRVTGVSPVMIGRDCYRVRFSDGSEITADADHLWHVEPDRRAPCVLTTREIAATCHYGSRGQRNRYAVPVAGAIKAPETDLPIDPYVLGAWLGDGHSASARIFSSFGRELASHGLIGRKRIPDAYLRASVRQREELLRGLMDADGYIGVNGRCEFTTTNHAIADGFAELVASLGIKTTRAVKRSKCVFADGTSVSGADAHRFSFLVYDDRPVFHLARKKARHISREGRRTTETERRRIVSVERCESVPVRCIRVEAEDHLFLAGREMIPTHNTEALNNAVGFFIDQDPSPILVLQPTIEMGQTWSKDRLAPMIRDTPALVGKVRDARSRDSGNTLLHKSFPGGHVTVAGANSAASLASRPVRVLLADEVDRYPESAGTEGDPIGLAVKRTTTFWNRKIILTSTPTVKGQSRIEAAYGESDQRRFYVPCPDCGHAQVLRWSNVRWPEGDPDAAEYACDECGSLWSDGARWAAVERGEWRAEAPFRGVAGFHLSEIYSPWVRLAETVQAFLDAKGNTERLKAWTNTSLGETWEERGEAVGAHQLQRLMDTYGPYDLPEDVAFATAGVDTQDDRLEVEVLGWGAGERSWGIRYEVIHGDPAQSEVWRVLDDLLAEAYSTASGRPVRILAAAVDSGGHHAEAVHRFCRDRFARRIYATKGQGGQGRPVWPARHSMARNRDRVFMIGVDTIKDMVHARWSIVDGDGACRLPIDQGCGYDDEWMAQAIAEERVTRYREGRPYTVWTLRKGKRNEALDCRVYATAAMRALPRATREIKPEPEAESRPAAPIEAARVAVQKGRPRRNSYLGIDGGRYV